MGWNSANPIFDCVADKLISLAVSDEIKTEVLSTLIGELQSGDWDTEDESLWDYRHDPAIVEAFRRNDVVLSSEDE